jgi:endonuclease/exonuclease/phosphatase (EEP) superfamily protein YafD
MTQTTGVVPAQEPEAPSPVRRSRALGVAIWTVVAGLALWAVVRLFGLERGYPFIQLISFTPYVAALAVPVPLVALALRRWPAAAVATLATAALAVAVLPRGFAAGDPLPAGPALRVLTANLKVGGADPARLVALVRTERVDLLAVQEYTPEAQRALDAGLGGVLPYRSAHPLPGVGGSALYSRFPLHDDGVRLNPYEFGQAQGTVSVPGAAPVAVESVHATAPASTLPGLGSKVTDAWARAMAAQPPATVDGPVRLLLGDFNATLDHAALRRLIGTGYRDAAEVTGQGLTMTWPYDKVFPRVALDHVLADRRVGVRRVAVYPITGSDHRAVLADLVLPPSASPGSVG